MNDDARSPGAGSTPGPLSQQAPVLDTSDPGKSLCLLHRIIQIHINNIILQFVYLDLLLKSKRLKILSNI